MGVTTGIIGAVAAVVGTGASVIQGNKARAAARHSADLQTQAQEDTNAQNAQTAADAQRQQIRDARVKQARILQSSTNTGADNSSGSLGAIGAVATNLSDNQGTMLGAQQRSQDISNLNQQAADSMFDSRVDSQVGQEFAQFGQIGSSIFGVASKTPSFQKAATSIFK